MTAATNIPRSLRDPWRLPGEMQWPSMSLQRVQYLRNNFKKQVFWEDAFKWWFNGIVACMAQRGRTRDSVAAMRAKLQQTKEQILAKQGQSSDCRETPATSSQPQPMAASQTGARPGLYVVATGVASPIACPAWGSRAKGMPWLCPTQWMDLKYQQAGLC